MLRADLRQRRGKALTHGGGTGVDRDLARWIDAHHAGLERPAPGALHRMGKTDAQIPALAARRVLALRKAVPVGCCQNFLMRGDVVATVIGDRRPRARFQWLGIGHLFRRDEIAAADLGAVDAKLARHAVHQPLHGEGRLRIARATHRGGRHLVGEADRDGDIIGRHNIGARHGGRGIIGQVHGLQRIGTLIVNEAAANAQDETLRIDRNLQRPILIALLDGGHRMLATVLDPFQRAAGEQRGGCQGGLFRIDAIFGTEAASDIGRDDTDLVFGEPGRLDDGGQQVVGHLRGRPDVEPAVRPAFGDHAARLHRMGTAAVLPEIFLEHVACCREGRVNIAIGDLELVEHIRRGLAADCDGGVNDRLADVGHHGQGFVIDLDQPDSVFRQCAAVGHDHAHGLADKGDFLARQDVGRDRSCRLGGTGTQRHPLETSDLHQVRHGDNRMHARQPTRLGHVEPRHQRMGMFAAQESDVQNAGQLNVIEKPPASAQQIVIFNAGHALSDQRRHAFSSTFFCRYCERSALDAKRNANPLPLAGRATRRRRAG